MRTQSLPLALALLFLAACKPAEEPRSAVGEPEVAVREETPAAAPEPAPSRFDIYATVRLSADLGHLSERQRQMIPLLIEASRIMDELFWLQAYGDREALLTGIEDPAMRRFADINYGPWDRRGRSFTRRT
jgi:hypothetical protein